MRDQTISWPEAGPSSQGIQGVGENLSKSNARNAGSLKRSTSARSPIGTKWSIARRYAVVVDAGSSGSRMQIYSWKDPRVDKMQREREGDTVKVLPRVEKGTWDGSGKDWQLKKEPGLSSFGPHPEDLDDYLRPLFDHASSIVPEDALADTPVYVLATAGMRLLPDAQRNRVLDQTCHFIQDKTPFKLGEGGCSDHVQVISGEEEGLLGWIAINYLMDGFHFKSTGITDGNAEGTKGRSTYGFLDMGGASTQIAFEPSQKALEKASSSTFKDATAAKEDLTAVTLRMLDGTDVTHNVFVTTFLGFGTNRARERYMDAIYANTTSTSTSLQDPCLPKGLEMPSNEGRLDVIGTGSFTQCLSHLSPLLDKDAACIHPPCLFHGVHVPPIDFSVNHFIGVSEYWFSSNDVFGLGGVYDFVSFQRAAQEFCGLPWDDLSEALKGGMTYDKQVDESRLRMQCFKAAWMTTVLHEGIGIPRIVDEKGKGDGKHHADEAQDKADEKNLFQSVNDVDGLSVSWTLGKAVWEASKDIPPPLSSGSESATVSSVPPSQPASTGASNRVPSWHRPSDPLAQLPPIRAGQHSISGATVLLFTLISFALLVVCCVFRGRGPKANRRRAFLREILPPPLGSLGGLVSSSRRPRGDYILANMEEAHDPDGGVDANGSGAIVLSSDGESDETDPRGRSRHKSRRSSGNGLVATLLVPIQRLALALGMRNATSHNGISTPHFYGRGPASLGQRRKHFNASTPTRLPLRRNISNPSLVARSTSRPASPSAAGATHGSPVMAGLSHSAAVSVAGGAISRPASRAGGTGRISPRSTMSPMSLSGTANAVNGSHTSVGALLGHTSGGALMDHHGSYFAASNTNHLFHPSRSGMSSATASAISSRAASPAFGGPPSTSTVTNPSTPGNNSTVEGKKPSAPTSVSGPTISRVNSSNNLALGRGSSQDYQGSGFSRRGWEEA